jgi:hypothetical protein
MSPGFGSLLHDFRRCRSELLADYDEGNSCWAEYTAGYRVESVTNFTRSIRLEDVGSNHCEHICRHSPYHRKWIVQNWRAERQRLFFSSDIDEALGRPQSHGGMIRILNDLNELWDGGSGLRTKYFEGLKSNGVQLAISREVNDCSNVQPRDLRIATDGLSKPLFPMGFTVAKPTQEARNCIRPNLPDGGSGLELGRRIWSIRTDIDFQPLTQLLPVIFRLGFPRPKRNHTNPY